MAAGPNDAGHVLSEDVAENGPTRPERVPRSIAWPDSANMVAQNGAANQTFERNSALLQSAAEAKRGQQNEERAGDDELIFVKDRGRSNYAELKNEHGTLVDQNRDDDKSQGSEVPEDELQFVKDGPRGQAPSSEQSQDRDNDQQLTFVKDQNHERGHGR